MIDFMKYHLVYFVISGLIIIPGAFSLVYYGFKLSVDFTGGTILEITLQKQREVDRKSPNDLKNQEANIREIIEAKGIEVENLGIDKENNTILLRAKPFDENKKNELIKVLTDKFGDFEEKRFETVGALLGQELINKTIVGILLASFLIMAYVAYQFREPMYGVCAILAMFHDSLIMLGSFSFLSHFFGVEIDTLFVTALLTILSFSVHDTVVVYDRIRESSKTQKDRLFYSLVNQAVNETLVRSLNNSMTIIFMLLALILLGGETIRWFAVALLIGTISGTYSSTFTAAPLLIVWRSVSKRFTSGKNTVSS